MSELRALFSPAQREIVDAITAQSTAFGQQVYLVGGAIRDWLLDAKHVDDLDFSLEGDTAAFAQTLRDRCGGELLLHAAFNTARWTLGSEQVDIAMARTETYARPAALPQVSPSTIDRDLGRRDFTINAIALRLRDGALIDPYLGQADLAQKQLRALHRNSFIDDPTRILRGARYAARLGFAVETETESWIREAQPLLRRLTGERMKYDLELIFTDRDPAAALKQLNSWGMFAALKIPGPSDAQLDTRFGRLADVIREDGFPFDTLAMPPERLLCAAGWGALTYNLSTLPVVRWMEWLPFETELRDALIQLGPLSTMPGAALHGKTSQQSKLLSEFDGLALLLGFLYDTHALKRRASLCEWKDWRWVRPASTGDDLRALGLPPGPRYREILAQLRAAWLDREIESFEAEQVLLQTLITAG
jgi:tRNA nucleotidyltransferase (CCA-adding enzyme)